MQKNDRIFVAGHNGLIGRAIVRALEAQGYTNILTRTHRELDLTRADQVTYFFEKEWPEHVILAAGKVGGIAINRTRPVDFLTTNLAIELNVINAAAQCHTHQLLFFGSSCMYPRECSQPMNERQIGSGHIEPTSAAYATAKMAGVALCNAHRKQHDVRFFSVIPNTVYGPHDHFDYGGHVIPSLIKKFEEAKRKNSPFVMLFGTGSPKREFVYADDVAEACIFLLNQEKFALQSVMNVGSGEEVSIFDLAHMIQSLTRFHGEVRWDTTQPDGAPRKLLDSHFIKSLGWRPKTMLFEGLEKTCEWFLENNK